MSTNIQFFHTCACKHIDWTWARLELYVERNCSLITHTNGPMGKVLNIWARKPFTEWFMSADKTYFFFRLYFCPSFSSSTLRCFCLGCPLILSWDRLMLHFIRHTINVIIFILLLLFLPSSCFIFVMLLSFNELTCFSVTWYSGPWWKMKMVRVHTYKH